MAESKPTSNFLSEDNRIQVMAGIIAAGVGAWFYNLRLEFIGTVVALIIFFAIEYYLIPIRRKLGKEGFEEFMKKLVTALLIIGILAVGQIAFLIAGLTFDDGNNRVFGAAYIAVVLGVLIGFFIHDIRKK